MKGCKLKNDAITDAVDQSVYIHSRGVDTLLAAAVDKLPNQHQFSAHNPFESSDPPNLLQLGEIGRATALLYLPT